MPRRKIDDLCKEAYENGLRQGELNRDMDKEKEYKDKIRSLDLQKQEVLIKLCSSAGQFQETFTNIVRSLTNSF